MRPVLLVASPSELSGLLSLLDVSLDGPSVDELLIVLDDSAGSLGVALGDVDGLDVELLGKVSPLSASLRHGDGHVGILGDVQQSLLHEVGNQTGVGTVGDQGGRAI